MGYPYDHPTPSTAGDDPFCVIQGTLYAGTNRESERKEREGEREEEAEGEGEREREAVCAAVRVCSSVWV